MLLKLKKKYKSTTSYFVLPKKKMSLLKETVADVISGDVLTIGNAWGSTFRQYENVNGYSVISGAFVPRDNGSQYLMVDNATGEPMVLPSNIVPWQVYIIPTVPLESTDLSSASVLFNFYDDISFNNSYNPWGTGYSTLTGEELNSGAFLQVDDGGSFSDFTGFPYLGGEVQSESFTAGSLQIYVYYISAYTPAILP